MSRPRDTSVLSSEQVASILGVTKRTLKNWLRSGRIPEPNRNPRNNYRVWTLTDIEVIRRILREEQ
jgi:excisionase family DNA binding protein